MKRPLTLTAGILGIVSHAVILVFSLINLIMGIALLGEGASAGADANILASAGIVMFVMFAVAIVIGILGLIFNILSVKTWNKDAEVYKAKKGKTICAIVFNFLGIIAVFLVMNIILAILLMLVLIAAGVLAIVDVCLEKKRVPASAEATVETTVEATAETPKSDLEAKIEKLNAMKEQGMITDAEYEELKKKYIQEQLNK